MTSEFFAISKKLTDKVFVIFSYHCNFKTQVGIQVHTLQTRNHKFIVQ